MRLLFLLPRRRRGAITKALQGVLQAVTEPLRSVTERNESVHSRYGAVTNLASRYGVGRLKISLCLTAAFAPVPAILGGSCPLGCSLSAPATGGLSMVSPQCSCMRQAPRKRSGLAAHFIGGTHSTICSYFAMGGWRGSSWTGVLLWPASSFNGGSGLACAAIPPAPPSNVFGYRGTRCTPGGGCAPCTPRGVGRELALAHRDACQPAPGYGYGDSL